MYNDHNGKQIFQFSGEKPSNKTTKLRFGLHWHVDVQLGKIIEGYGIFDLPGFFIQSGIDLFSRAREQAVKISLLNDEEHYIYKSQYTHV